MKMKLVVGRVAPNSGARTEHFYSGELKVFNDEVETDNPNWIAQLRERGYKPIDEMTAEDKALWPSETTKETANAEEESTEDNTVPNDDEAEVYQSDAAEPQGRAVVQEENFEDFLAVEREEPAKGPVDESHTDEPFFNQKESDPWAILDEYSDDEPSDLELMMSEAMGKRRSK